MFVWTYGLSFIYRSLWPNDIFGNETDNAVQTLLHIYFRHQTLGQTGCLAVVGPSRDLSQASTRLMELNLQIREALSQAQACQPLTTMVSTGLWTHGTAGCEPGLDWTKIPPQSPHALHRPHLSCRERVDSEGLQRRTRETPPIKG